MKTIFYELIEYLRQSSDSFYFDDNFCQDSLESEILAFASMIEERIQ